MPVEDLRVQTNRLLVISLDQVRISQNVTSPFLSLFARSIFPSMLPLGLSLARAVKPGLYLFSPLCFFVALGFCDTTWVGNLSGVWGYIFLLPLCVATGVCCNTPSR
ncbi:uncharacterized protein BO72DRAFT_72968 [Aspergillus fijiensis CBS 313.89]|uniref:Uncharacterized protein n=1 Tax=Aspergillus fijiensis CBS 313.89 TaxID=1448319 RepID=A0A8G1VZL2_9EURO|nr:uncharacterized protein BO72DRAFT_72968 [Aspergillus fijiensis CBS 313.89]RAK78407.1 hypothetical protein BO72DRAFT_72968 [Aspergillus fijiensis CBS 313.89]